MTQDKNKFLEYQKEVLILGASARLVKNSIEEYKPKSICFDMSGYFKVELDRDYNV